MRLESSGQGEDPAFLWTITWSRRSFQQWVAHPTCLLGPKQPNRATKEMSWALSFSIAAFWFSEGKEEIKQEKTWSSVPPLSLGLNCFCHENNLRTRIQNWALSSSDVAVQSDLSTHWPTCEEIFLEHEIGNEHVKDFSILNVYRAGLKGKLRSQDVTVDVFIWSAFLVAYWVCPSLC